VIKKFGPTLRGIGNPPKIQTMSTIENHTEFTWCEPIIVVRYLNSQYQVIDSTEVLLHKIIPPNCPVIIETEKPMTKPKDQYAMEVLEIIEAKQYGKNQ